MIYYILFIKMNKDNIKDDIINDYNINITKDKENLMIFIDKQINNIKNEIKEKYKIDYEYSETYKDKNMIPEDYLILKQYCFDNVDEVIKDEINRRDGKINYNILYSELIEYKKSLINNINYYIDTFNSILYNNNIIKSTMHCKI